jgi:hypothetical protein
LEAATHIPLFYTELFGRHSNIRHSLQQSSPIEGVFTCSLAKHFRLLTVEVGKDAKINREEYLFNSLLKKHLSPASYLIVDKTSKDMIPTTP